MCVGAASSPTGGLIAEMALTRGVTRHSAVSGKRHALGGEHVLYCIEYSFLCFRCVCE